MFYCIILFNYQNSSKTQVKLLPPWTEQEIELLGVQGHAANKWGSQGSTRGLSKAKPVF